MNYHPFWILRISLRTSYFFFIFNIFIYLFFENFTAICPIFWSKSPGILPSAPPGAFPNPSPFLIPNSTSLPYWVSLEPTVCACVWGHPLQQGPLPAGTPPQAVWSSFPSSHQLATALLLGLGGGSRAPSYLQWNADCLQLSGSMQINTAAARLQPQRPSYAQKILSRPFLLFAQKQFIKE